MLSNAVSQLNFIQNSFPETLSLVDTIIFSNCKWTQSHSRCRLVAEAMGKDRNVLFVEYPDLSSEGKKFKEVNAAGRRMLVYSSNDFDFNALLESLPDSRSKITAWIYSPAFTPILEYTRFSKLVYDCTEEILPGETIRNLMLEKRLISMADCVFTSSKSLYDEKRIYCDNIHYMPGLPGLDWVLNQSLCSETACKNAPVVGYYGNIDEKIDLDFVAECVKSHPDVQFEFAGPLINVSREQLPKAMNFAYLGMMTDSDMAKGIKNLDAALLPYFTGESFKHIDPHTPLPYLASGVPVISTGVYNIVSDLGHCVQIVFTPREFSKAFIKTLENPGEEKQKCRDIFQSIFEKSNWKSTVNRMQELIYV